jgi:hypothetical protein
MLTVENLRGAGACQPEGRHSLHGEAVLGGSGGADGITPASPPTPPDVRGLPHPAVEPGSRYLGGASSQGMTKP